MSSLGSRLKRARERKNLKQTEVMRKTGINNKTLSGYENGVSEPDVDTLNILANLYEVSVDSLLGRTDVKNDKIQYNDVDTTIHLIKETAAKYGYKVNDPEFLKILSKAFDIIEVTRRQDSN